MKIIKPSVLAVAAVLCLLLAACSGGGNTESMLASAKEYMAKNDNKAAIIQIKNALQKSPNSAEARLMLATALLAVGDVVAAELEFRKALELKQSADLVVPPLAKTMLAMGQFKKLTDEFGKTQLGTPQANAELQTTLASAYAGLGNAEAVGVAIKKALTAQPDFLPALIAQVRQKAALSDFDGALASIEDLLVKSPGSYEAWKLKGDIFSYGKNRFTDALAAYRKSIEFKPDFTAGHVAALTVLLSQDNLAEAAKQLDQLKKLAPNTPQTRYFQAQLAYQNRDFKLARDLSQQLLKMAPDYPRGMQLAGAVEFQLNSLVQAEALLSKAVQAAPELTLARRLLILTYLRSGQPAKALTALTPAMSRNPIDPQIYAVAGEVFLQNGDLKKAEENFTKAIKQDPKDSRKRTSLALTHLMAGDTDIALGELQDIAASDKGTTADLALISAYLRRGEFDKALKAIDVLEKKQPDKPLSANLRGKTLLAKKDFIGARKSFERALVLDPMYFPAVASLATMDLVDKKPEEARKRFEAVVAKDPKNGQALLALAEMALRTNASKDEVAGLISRAIAANPDTIGPYLMLIDFHLRNKDFKQALSVAQNAVATLPDNPSLLDALGRAQIASGEVNQAISTYNKLISLQPQSPQPQLRLADIYLGQKNKDGVRQSLQKALEIKPDLLEAQQGLVALYVDDKKYPDAFTVIQKIQRQRPKEAVGYLMEGDVNAAQKNWDAAVAAYRAGLKIVDAPELAIRMHSALTVSNKPGDADKLAAGWSKDHPKDAIFLLYLGDQAIARNDLAGAEKYYLMVIKLQGNMALAYNNLAWVTGRLHKEGAIGYAENAIKLAPNQAAFMDTLAMLLLEKNDTAKALEWQQKALVLEPQNAMFKLGLAKIYVKDGKKDLARKELDDLAKLGNKFPGQPEVTNLLKAL